MNRHYLNKPGFYKLAQSVKDYINRKITGYAKLGTASTKDFTTYVSPTQTEQLPISSSVYSAMTNMLRGAYHPAGSKTIAELTSGLLVKANLGNVYKITEDGVTSDLFIGGAGQTIKTGDNAIVLYASEDTYRFSLESGVVDLDAYQKKELTSGALIEDVIPSNASASNKLVTAQEYQIFARQESALYTYYKLPNFFTYTTSPDNHLEYFICGNATYAQLEWALIDSTFRTRAWYMGNTPWTFSRDGNDLYISISNYPFKIQRKTILGRDNKANALQVTSIPSTATTIVTSQLIANSDLTSSVTAGSSAPLTAGGAWNNFAQKTRVTATSTGTVTLALQNSALYRVTVDRHQQDTFLGEYLLGLYGTSSITSLTINESAANQVTFTHDGNTLTVKSGNTYITVYTEYMGGYN